MIDSKVPEHKFGLSPTVIASIRSVLQLNPRVEKVILYGSRAMGNYRDNSDIDICLIGESLTLEDLFALENQLDDLLLPWKIDLSLQHRIDNPKLIEHIERVGVTL